MDEVYCRSSDSSSRSKLASNKTIDFPPELSKAIADITEDFSFAYLKEVFITSLLVIVAVQRGTNKDFSEVPEGANGEPSSKGALKLESNLLYRVLLKQTQTLRHEMEGSRKSAEEAGKHKTPNGPVTSYRGVVEEDAVMSGRCSGPHNATKLVADIAQSMWMMAMNRQGFGMERGWHIYVFLIRRELDTTRYTRKVNRYQPRLFYTFEIFSFE